MEVLSGRIIDVSPSGALTIAAKYDNIDRIVDRNMLKAEVAIGLNDGRKASPEQIRKAYALIGEIAAYSGDSPDYIKRLMKLKFISLQQQELAKQLFSFSTCDVTTAREFISYLVDFVLEYDVPTKQPLVELCEDISRYVYACASRKRCAVCGQKAELHHVDQVGMGRDRTEIIHEGMQILPLCGAHHTETHSIGKETFCQKYHLQPVPLDKKLCKIWGVKAAKQ